jgi:hypothetical protein
MNKYLEKVASGLIIDVAPGLDGVHRMTGISHPTPAVPGASPLKIRDITPMSPKLSRGLKIGGGILTAGLAAGALFHSRNKA